MLCADWGLCLGHSGGQSGLVLLDITACGGIVRGIGGDPHRPANPASARRIFRDDHPGSDPSCHADSFGTAHHERGKGISNIPLPSGISSVRHSDLARLCCDGEYQAGLLLHCLHYHDPNICSTLPAGELPPWAFVSLHAAKRRACQLHRGEHFLYSHRDFRDLKLFWRTWWGHVRIHCSIGLSVQLFKSQILLTFMLNCFLGGLGYVFGPMLGTLVLYFGWDLLFEFGKYQMLIYSTILIIIIRFLPNGLLSIRFGKGGDK